MRFRLPSRHALRRSGMLFAELFVVFAGVYGAFLLDGYRQGRQLERRREQITSTLCLQAGQVGTNIRRFIGIYDSSYAEPFMQAYRDGERPLPQPLDFFAGAFDTGMWTTLLQSGGLDALEYETITRAQRFYGALENASAYGHDFARRLNDHVLPALEEGTAAFYRPGTDELKPAYRWYPSALQAFSYHLETLQAAADSLAADLDCPDVQPL